MKKSLLALAAFAAITSANAQTTYNYFDPADCDADGWLWFDTQEKIDKYCGWDNNYKIQLLTATYENSDMEYAEPVLDPTVKGYNAAGEEGAEGTKTGAIIIPRASTYGTQNGGGILLQLPSCAEFSVYMSCKSPIRQLILLGAKNWVERIDLGTITGFVYPFNSLTDDCQYTWNNLQNEKNGNTGMTLLSPAGNKVTGALVNDMTTNILIQGIKVLCYTSDGSGVADVEIADQNAPVEYYNLQGIRVANPENGLFIRRQGSKTEKVIL